MKYSRTSSSQLTSGVLLPEGREHIYEKSKAPYNSFQFCMVCPILVLRAADTAEDPSTPKLTSHKKVTPATPSLTWSNVCRIKSGFRIPESLPHWYLHGNLRCYLCITSIISSLELSSQK